MNNPPNLFSWILFGDFGLLTMAPRYLFLVLFPVMIFLGFLSQILVRLPIFNRHHSLANQFFYCVAGLGCTTAALASLHSIEDGKTRNRLVWMLILLIPCSSQLAIIATFATMVTFRVFAVYLCFTMFFIFSIYLLLNRLLPLSDVLMPICTKQQKFSPFHIIKDALLSVTDTIVPFAIGSVLVSLAMYLGILDWLCALLAAFMDHFLHLPPEATGLLVLNILKRDFGSATLLAFAGGGTFDAVQMVVLLIMMTFSVPCFNSSVLLFKQKKLPALIIWRGTLFISLLLGKIVSAVLLVCVL